jgi:3-carboxy-cis,cis-muconate cycloisomerase
MSYTPFNAPLLSGLLGDMEAAAHFGVKEELASMLSFERSLACAQSELGMISDDARAAIVDALEEFQPDVQKLSARTSIDGVCVPELIRQLREAVGDTHSKSLHYLSTSQDVVDTSAMMRMRACTSLLIGRLKTCIKHLHHIAADNSAHRLMGYTRMQAALEITSADRINSWLNPLENQMHKLEALEFPIQIGGPVGRADAYGGKAKELAERISQDLGLSNPKQNWQNDRTPMFEICNALCGLAGQLGKMGADISLMAQMGPEQIVLSGGGSSSAMAHKNNPIDAEALISIARFNSGLLSILHGTLVHEQERSGSAWTTEWMVVPQVFVTTAAALRNSHRLLNSIERIGLDKQS